MDLLAQTSTGPVEGRVKEGVLLFAGIPFAEAPVGRLRFAPPAPHPDWREPRSAQRFGNAAMQPAGSGLT
jgi:para-nitrobenzyl esterase